MGPAAETVSKRTPSGPLYGPAAVNAHLADIGQQAEEMFSNNVVFPPKAMHLLEAGINIFYIKDFLGHENISTTEVYAKASIETQRQALKKHSLVMPPATPSSITNTDTLEWLKSLGK